jgi:predicted ATPase
VAPKVAGSSPVGHPSTFCIDKPNRQKAKEFRYKRQGLLTPLWHHSGEAREVQGRHIRTSENLYDTTVTLEAYDSARLFADRAAGWHPGFEITPENAPVVARVCARLEGIPLAIELAAARLGLLSVEQISERLGHSLKLLTGGKRTAATGH